MIIFTYNNTIKEEFYEKNGFVRRRVCYFLTCGNVVSSVEVNAEAFDGQADTKVVDENANAEAIDIVESFLGGLRK